MDKRCEISHAPAAFVAACAVLFCVNTVCAQEKSVDAATQVPSDEVSNAGQSVHVTDSVRADLLALEARALLQLKKYSEADAAALDAIAIDPGNIEALSVRAELAERNAGWSTKLAHWESVGRNAHTLEHRQEVDRRINELRHAFGSRLSARAFYLGDAGVDEQYGLRAEARIVRPSAIGLTAALESRRFETPNGLDMAGAPLPIAQTGWRGEIGGFLNRGRNEWSAALSASDDVVGGRLRYERQIVHGASGIALEGNTPYWIYSQGVQNGAALDAVTAYARQHFSRYSWDASLAWNNYTVDSRTNVANSFRAEAGVAMRLREKVTAPRVEARFDGEYFNDIKQRRNRDGVLFSDLPLGDRAVVSLGAGKLFQARRRQGFSESSYVDIGAGYRFDLEGDEGPFVRAAAGLALSPKTSLTASAEYSAVATRRQTSDDYTAVILTLTRRFAQEKGR